MRNKHFYNDTMENRGRGRRGRGRLMGRGNAYGPRAAFYDADGDFGPPPWAGRRGWVGPMPEDADEDGEDFGPMRSGMGPRMWEREDISTGERRAWLLARRARLQAWRTHLDARLAETEAELTKLETTATPPNETEDAPIEEEIDLSEF